MKTITNVDSDTRPILYSLNLEGYGAEHRTMGVVTLEKRIDGKLYANGREVVRYISPNQQSVRISGHELRRELRELKDKQTLNACILDALLANQELIPEEWENGINDFWGTIFRHATGDLYIKRFYWSGSKWDTHIRNLEKIWGTIEFAVCLVDAPPAA